MEATAGIVEDTLFPGVAQKRFYAPNLAYAGNYVVKVTPNNSYGPKRFLPVSQGDTVNAYVQAYTERPAPIQTSVSKPGKLLTWFAGMVGVNRGDANIKPIPTAGIALALGVSQSPAVFSSNATGPAEMKWKFYDSDSVLVDEGAVEMSGNTGDWEELSKQLIAEQAGYIELSLKGGGSTSYFDNFGGGVSGQVLELHHYYPYGKEIGDLSYSDTRLMEGQTPHSPLPYGFGSKRKLDWAGIPFQDFGARMYDPQIGRWNAIDPMATERAA